MLELVPRELVWLLWPGTALQQLGWHQCFPDGAWGSCSLVCCSEFCHCHLLPGGGVVGDLPAQDVVMESTVTL